jgi:HTH-type transcriptional regulator / antitoxin HipB
LNRTCEQFKIGVILRQARETAGLTQEPLAIRLKTKKTAISRIENHAEDIKLSTLDRVAKALGKRLQVHIAKGSIFFNLLGCIPLSVVYFNTSNFMLILINLTEMC